MIDVYITNVDLKPHTYIEKTVLSAYYFFFRLLHFHLMGSYFSLFSLIFLEDYSTNSHISHVGLKCCSVTEAVRIIFKYVWNSICQDFSNCSFCRDNFDSIWLSRGESSLVFIVKKISTSLGNSMVLCIEMGMPLNHIAKKSFICKCDVWCEFEWKPFSLDKGSTQVWSLYFACSQMGSWSDIMLINQEFSLMLN